MLAHEPFLRSLYSFRSTNNIARVGSVSAAADGVSEIGTGVEVGVAVGTCPIAVAADTQSMKVIDIDKASVVVSLTYLITSS